MAASDWLKTQSYDRIHILHLPPGAGDVRAGGRLRHRVLHHRLRVVPVRRGPSARDPRRGVPTHGRHPGGQ